MVSGWMGNGIAALRGGLSAISMGSRFSALCLRIDEIFGNSSGLIEGFALVGVDSAGG